ncbi:hypothetical protein LZ30DRAFT_742480 [Colletotrichum cereale]|nr:hypothetical protein LZ30DRAFT_742480 [Colletotrichum cereale]
MPLPSGHTRGMQQPHTHGCYVTYVTLARSRGPKALTHSQTQTKPGHTIPHHTMRHSNSVSTHSAAHHLGFHQPARSPACVSVGRSQS